LFWSFWWSTFSILLWKVGASEFSIANIDSAWVVIGTVSVGLASESEFTLSGGWVASSDSSSFAVASYFLVFASSSCNIARVNSARIVVVAVGWGGDASSVVASGWSALVLVSAERFVDTSSLCNIVVDGAWVLVVTVWNWNFALSVGLVASWFEERITSSGWALDCLDDTSSCRIAMSL
jgi:hypothetical protein